MKTRILCVALLSLPIMASGNSAFAQTMYGMGGSSMRGGAGMTSPGATGGNPAGGGTMGGATGGASGGSSSQYGGGSYGGGGYGATTVAGSYLNAAAALVQGWGQYNLDTAHAARDLEDANHRAIENRLDAQKGYYELRRLNKADWLADHPRSTPEQLAKINQSRLPRRLGSNELDPIWGTIRWPAVLDQREFAAIRQQLDDLFAHRSEQQFGVGSAFYTRTQKLARDMRTLLDQEHASISQMEWIHAMRFIESLAYETRFAPETAAGMYTLAK